MLGKFYGWLVVRARLCSSQPSRWRARDEKKQDRSMKNKHSFGNMCDKQKKKQPPSQKSR